MTSYDQVKTVANKFAKVSNEYCPIDLSRLPAYLPAEEPPKVELYKVYKKVQSQKKTRSTFGSGFPPPRKLGFDVATGSSLFSLGHSWVNTVPAGAEVN